jgi:hypothetical protein
MAAPIVASAIASDPKLVRGAAKGIAIYVVLAVIVSGYATYKLLQKLGIIDDASDRLAEKWQEFMGAWKGLDPNYGGDAATISQTRAIQLADTINSGINTLFSADDEATIYSALQEAGSAANLSKITAYYNYRHGNLRNTLLSQLRSDKEVKQMAQIFSNYTDFQKSVRDSNLNL